MIDWTVIDSAKAAQDFASQLDEAQRSFADRTSISGGIDFAMAQLNARRFTRAAAPSMCLATAPTILAAM